MSRAPGSVAHLLLRTVFQNPNKVDFHQAALSVLSVLRTEGCWENKGGPETMTSPITAQATRTRARVHAQDVTGAEEEGQTDTGLWELTSYKLGIVPKGMLVPSRQSRPGTPPRPQRWRAR